MNDTIFFASCDSYDGDVLTSAMEGLFQEIAVAKELNASTKVLLKPNLLSKLPPERAVTTHPEIVRAVIRGCVARGVRKENIIVADSAGGLYNTKQTKALYQVCGMTKVAEEEGVVLYSDCQSQRVDCKGQGYFTILQPVLDVDFIINLPKFKTHVMTGMTAGVKNMFGIIPGLDKSQWHTRYPERDPFGEMLMDLYELFTPNLTILDGILGMEGDGPGGGTPRELGILMASENTLHLDLAVAEMMGLDPMIVPYLKAGFRRNLCERQANPKEMSGDTHLFAPIIPWELPKSYQNGNVGTTSFAGNAPKFLQPLAKKVEEVLAPRPVVLGEKCINCKRCSEICSKDAINFPDKKAFIVKKKCIRCFCCHEVCPVKAIDVKKSGIFSK